jgi:hypothetical protein
MLAETTFSEEYSISVNIAENIRAFSWKANWLLKIDLKVFYNIKWGFEKKCCANL